MWINGQESCIVPILRLFALITLVVNSLYTPRLLDICWNFYLRKQETVTIPEYEYHSYPEVNSEFRSHLRPGVKVVVLTALNSIIDSERRQMERNEDVFVKVSLFSLENVQYTVEESYLVLIFPSSSGCCHRPCCCYHL